MFGTSGSKKPSKPPAKLMKTLARRGPHRVLSGNLGIVGMDGRVFAPAEGTRLPAVAFGHHWLTGSSRYRDLLCHLASWGIVVAAPDGQRGLMPSDVGYAGELRGALSVVSHAPLGDGGITVDPRRVGYVGHGFGASAAVIAASTGVVAGQPAIEAKAVVALFPSPTTPVLEPAAGTVTAPGLILASPLAVDTVDANARPLARAYGGDVVLRTLPGASSRGLLERRTVKSLIGLNGADKLTHTQVRALLTGFLLHSLTLDKDYAGFADPTAVIGKTLVVDPEVTPEGELDHVSALLGAKPRKRRGKAAAEIPVP